MNKKCPGCGGAVRQDAAAPIGIGTCRRCGGLIGTCYRGEAYALVAMHQSMMVESEDTRYFDLTLLGSEIQRVHGWMDRTTRRVVQYG